MKIQYLMCGVDNCVKKYNWWVFFINFKMETFEFIHLDGHAVYKRKKIEAYFAIICSMGHLSAFQFLNRTFKTVKGGFNLSLAN